MPPLVSVIIGAYNRERYIRECVDSVLAQTYAPLEVIVVDDASTDRTVELLRAYGVRIRLICSERNSGLPAVPRNRALELAQGEFIAFLDSDDAWLPDKIEKQVAFLQAYPACGLVHTYAYLMDGASACVGIRHEGTLPPTGWYFPVLLQHCCITLSTVLVPRPVLAVVGGFNAEPQYRAREDFEWLLRVARRWPVGLLAEPLAKYRRAPTGISQQAAAWRSLPEDVVAQRLVVERPDLWRGVVPRAQVVAALVAAVCENARYWRERHCAGRALWFVGQALPYAPLQPRLWYEAFRALLAGLRAVVCVGNTGSDR